MINNKEFNERIKLKLKEIEQLFDKKNAQYSTDDDPFQAFKAGALLLYGNDTYTAQYETLKAYMAKHIAHMYNNGLNGPKVNESIMDVITYNLIAAVLYDLVEEKKQNV